MRTGKILNTMKNRFQNLYSDEIIQSWSQHRKVFLTILWQGLNPPYTSLPYFSRISSETWLGCRGIFVFPLQRCGSLHTIEADSSSIQLVHLNRFRGLRAGMKVSKFTSNNLFINSNGWLESLICSLYSFQIFWYLERSLASIVSRNLSKREKRVILFSGNLFFLKRGVFLRYKDLEMTLPTYFSCIDFN